MRTLLAALVAFTFVACNDGEAERQAAKAHQEAEKARKEAVTARLGPDVRKLLAKVDLLRPALSGVPKPAEGAAPPSTEPRMKLSESRSSSSLEEAARSLAAVGLGRDGPGATRANQLLLFEDGSLT